jgi:hypothetical protein
VLIGVPLVISSGAQGRYTCKVFKTDVENAGEFCTDPDAAAFAYVPDV